MLRLIFEFAAFTVGGCAAGFFAGVWIDKGRAWESERQLSDLTRERNMWRAVWKDSPRPPCEQCGYHRGTPREEERALAALSKHVGRENTPEVRAEIVRDLEALPRFADSPHWMWQMPEAEIVRDLDAWELHWDIARETWQDFLQRRNESS